MASLRSQMGIVPQNSFLFSGTVADNIRYAGWATDEEVNERLGWPTPTISSRGSHRAGAVRARGSLSARQRQLVAFARAILADRGY